MKREDIVKLLGGYATGTLSVEEQRALFDAAAADQTLFDALADEEALRQALADPASRRRLLEALQPAEPTLTGWFTRWLRRPSTLALAGTASAAIVIAVVWVQFYARPTAEPVEIAKVEPLKAELLTAVPKEKAAPASPAPRRVERRQEEPSVALAPTPPAAAPAEPSAVQNTPEADRAPQQRQFQTGAASQMPQMKDQKAESAEQFAAAEGRREAKVQAQASEAAADSGRAKAGVAGGAPASPDAVGTVASAFRADEMSTRTNVAPLRARMTAAGAELRYRVLRDSNEVRAGTKLAAGDRLQFAIESGAAGYLYVFLNDGANWRTLEAGRRITAAATVNIPDSVPITYAPEMRLLLLRSRVRIPELEAADPRGAIARVLSEPMGDGRTWVVVHLGTL